MKKLYIILILAVLLLSGCGQKQVIDNNCKHEWVVVDSYSIITGVLTHVIYCPKCKSEQRISVKEWNKIQADMEYENEMKGE